MIINLCLEKYLNKILNSKKIKDSTFNGLQIEGEKKIRNIISGVSISLKLIKKAIKYDADTIIVHHGFFWKNDPISIRSIKKNRIKLILLKNINLFGYHLPLDIHKIFGNNIKLGEKLNFILKKKIEALGCKDLIYIGCTHKEFNPEEFSKYILKKIGQNPFSIISNNKKIKNIAWCTGAGQNLINILYEYKTKYKIDTFISGEISERTVYEAKEMRINYYSAGHYNTEKYGIKALGNHISKKFDLIHKFCDIPNSI